MARHIQIIDGPKLNPLGLRNYRIGGRTTLAGIRHGARKFTDWRRPALSLFNSTLDRTPAARARAAGVAFRNRAAALGRLSVLPRCGKASVVLPLSDSPRSDIPLRQDWRHPSYLADTAEGFDIGLGPARGRCAPQFVLELAPS